MSRRRSTLFYGLLIVLASVLAGMVIASRLDLAPASLAQALTAPSSNSTPLSGPVDATTFRTIAKAVSPAVVNIRTESKQRSQDLFDFFGGGGGGGGRDQSPFDRRFSLPGPQDDDRPRERTVQATGTGFIINTNGLILTNNHVVEGTTVIKVSLYGEDKEQQYNAKIVGRDPLTDSALIQITDKVDHTLPVTKFGDSEQMEPGDWVMAIGNPFGLAHTVSVGVISGIGRGSDVIDGLDARGPKFLQTDAAINPGNSGGPLLNLRGEVVGINTAIFAEAGGQGNIGIGFAVPINAIRDLLPQLSTGKVTRGRIGVGLEAVNPNALDEIGLKNRDGAVITTVMPDSAASKAGVKAGDVLTSYDGKPVKRVEDLMQMVTATKPGSTVQARLVRDRQEKTVNLVVDELDLETETGGTRRSAPEPKDTKDEPELSRGFGLLLGPVTAEAEQQCRINGAKGALIYSVDPESPAARARLGKCDMIVRIGKQTVSSTSEAEDALKKVPEQGTALVWYLRRGQEFFVTMTKE
ncbi:MAG TPA: trypsin-like peptidase domain-containing protein [Vicinamibacterales bacterium]|nr:trypsin-like peptidase domain-containing protein [Vicinamibacterales bacterium]